MVVMTDASTEWLLSTVLGAYLLRDHAPNEPSSVATPNQNDEEQRIAQQGCSAGVVPEEEMADGGDGEGY